MAYQKLLHVAVLNFYDAQALHGERQVLRIALGLMQVALARKMRGRNVKMLEVAATNFDRVSKLSPDRQLQALALGLQQLAAGLR